MDFDDQIEIEHLLFSERKCRVCGELKDLVDGFYLTRKGRGFPSSYSYECKECTISRIIDSRKKNLQKSIDFYYPDW